MPDLHTVGNQHLSPAGALSDDDDAALLARSAAGDRAAFDAFAARHSAAVVRFATHMTEERDRADDVVQETFVAAWSGAAGYRGGSARAWLIAIARNALRRQFRRADDSAPRISMDELALRAGWGAASDDDVLRRLEARELVARGLAALPAEEREILLLRDMEGLSGADAASALGITLEAQKSRLHRARLRFIAELRGLDDEG